MNVVAESHVLRSLKGFIRERLNGPGTEDHAVARGDMRAGKGLMVVGYETSKQNREEGNVMCSMDRTVPLLLTK